MTFEIPEGYSIISEEEHADAVRESAEPHKFVTAGVIRKGWLSDIWTVSEDDEPEYLVDCN
ncbi:hypothetical protein AXJ18_gp051 [Streptomyces phage Jay2Jay]|uniref:Uncharacterized protein n=2 Tax=Samistivirus jay2jay TaxID=2560786 RepID=A0A0A0RLI6_9CAUD|nr:hypothetical protein AXJ18_gp015 [Streptomyces phage Jay2Jay]YP_009225950.1 hypothetical protein AXJ18_gp051 [Streptomyces phage Jay2Jay]ASN73090.1 hypothetical protein SEA_WARPY_15 [Streptomyces phage Warpy]AIW02514.1 hypothetical protein PBI_JAY2JAY_15 [Streptomyces phage Jay2Jay]AIW02723.1 hypothetical protein PBI_JAY2JAY_270 [Streptomyces phage Jay2Jay]ASN73297.1 hypothetical protein SEA_WARPY_267 [Streptomyces phage Warpy]